MPLTTGPIENTGNQPANAASVRIKILNLTGGTLTGVVRVFRLNGTRRLLSTTAFAVNANASTFITRSVLGSAQYEVEIVPDQNGGLYSVYGRTASGVIITAQRVLNSELTEIH
ncbi:ATPase [Lysinibacillus sphaericus]|uniref:ATPase n=1 Tax=Lysinibacillus sphaericus TaxID=1421 RepID=UPI0018CD005D|nr:ATPase [Lysinibacillus sphaericus]MBG9456170.1 ATPase [Lysinibacillus sphaericus]MBG9479166.1 ATPase [Lysinibacillus sphaericus]MBG9591537.1 ATPase [Lysinibacillus sphaericus]